MIIKYIRNSFNDNLTFIDVDAGVLINNMYNKEIIQLPSNNHQFDYYKYGNSMCEVKNNDSVIICSNNLYKHTINVNYLLSNSTNIKEISVGLYNNDTLVESNNYIILNNNHFNSIQFTSLQYHKIDDSINIKIIILQDENNFSNTNIIISELKWEMQKM